MSGLYPFEILEIPASGSYSTVVVARAARGDVVACKVLKKGLVDNAEALTRLRDEARMLSKLEHPSIVRVHDLLNLDERPVLVMEWVEGMDLGKLLRLRPEGLPGAVVCGAIAQASSALEAAWGRAVGTASAPLGIIHRDIKPENLLLDVHGRIRVADFGTAKARFDEREARTVAMVMGSRGFMAPEWMLGDDPTPAVDVYGLGISAILLLTGKLPVVSHHFERHDVAIDAIIDTLSPEGMSADRVETLRRLLRSMCRYEPLDRPAHPEIMLGMWDCCDDPEGALRAFAQEVVEPELAARSATDPREHPDFEEVAFLGTATRWERLEEPAISPEQSDTQLRAFLCTRGWETRGPELQLLLANAGRWTAAPFLEVLARGDRPWWRVWSLRASPEELAMALDFLRQRRSPEVEKIARGFLGHADERVRRAASALVGE